VVAHRPSTVQLADRVALLSGGRIAAVGRHSELLASSEHYRFVISSLEDEGGTPRRSSSPPTTPIPIVKSGVGRTSAEVGS
jgi:ATP-binding cassette subfamily B protein